MRRRVCLGSRWRAVSRFEGLILNAFVLPCRFPAFRPSEVGPLPGLAGCRRMAVVSLAVQRRQPPGCADGRGAPVCCRPLRGVGFGGAW